MYPYWLGLTQSPRAAVLDRQRTSVEAIGDQHVVAQRVFDDEDGAIAIASAGSKMSGAKGWREQLVEVAQEDALPAQIARAPPGDAMRSATISRRGRRDSDAASSQAVSIPPPEISIDGESGVTGSRAIPPVP